MHGCGHTRFRPKDDMISLHTNVTFAASALRLKTSTSLLSTFPTVPILLLVLFMVLLVVAVVVMIVVLVW